MTNVKKEYESFSGMSLLIIYLTISLGLFYSGLLNWNIERESSLCMIGFSILSSIVCFFGLWRMKNKVLNKFLTILVVPLFVVGVLVQNNIQDIYATHQYKSLDRLMIKSYAGIVDTPVYQAFLIDKNNNNISKISEYKRNIGNYVSIDEEKVMQLKLFYAVTNNKDIHSELNEVFNDGLVTKVEYEKFKSFMYQSPLNNDEQIMFTMIQQ